jgi:D-alanyl-lipoteichoic acid acyltransferase DltB (MBOAT superfamily)
MEIISIQYAIISIICGIIFYFLNHKFRIPYLAILSCGFVASYSYFLLIYILIYTLANFYIALKIPTSKHNKGLYLTGIILNLSQLILLKYASFAIDPLLRILNNDLAVSKLSDIIMPVGISYFTLQGIGYIVNVKMGWEKPEKNFLNFFLYIIFFPKFLSGPIERSKNFLPQIKEIKGFSEQQVSEGLRIALFGFFKKVTIANQLSLIVTQAHSDIDTCIGANLWFATFVQPIYLYFDFSGYTDIAIGFAKVFGINLSPNFYNPFLSENMTGFWRRFHISLSSWMNDYIFKQVSFKYRRWGTYASIYALILTWLIFGIWHGAGWNFMILGLVQALALIYEFLTKRIRANFFSLIPSELSIWIGRSLTFTFYSLSLIFFFASDIKSAIYYFTRLLKLNSPIDFAAFDWRTVPALGISLIFLSFEYITSEKKKFSNQILKIWERYSTLRIIFYYFLIMWIIAHFGEKLTFVYQAF